MEKAELQQLAARAEQGDSAAWDALYREIGAIAASVCRKYNMSATPENEVAGFSPDRLIDDFLAELPEDQRVALTMRYCDGYTNAQIAEKLGVPPGHGRFACALRQKGAGKTHCSI